jgi:hypothetical protein
VDQVNFVRVDELRYATVGLRQGRRALQHPEGARLAEGPSKLSFLRRRLSVQEIALDAQRVEPADGK